jgi:hypothetical protein
VPWQLLTLFVVALAAASTGTGWRTWASRLLCAVPVAWVLLALLVPLETGGQMRAALYDAAQFETDDWLTGTARWLAAGGRSGLALAAGAGCALLSGAIALRWPPCARTRA